MVRPLDRRLERGGAMSRELSVTEVRNALRCPRVFALGRLRGQQVQFPLGASSLGSAFHRIVENFTRRSDDPPTYFRALEPGASPEMVAEKLSRWLVEILVEELEANPAYSSMPAEVDDLAEALRELARYLARNSSQPGIKPSDAVASFLQDAERPSMTTIELPGGTVVGLSGRADAIHVHPSGLMEVVEYKLTDEKNEEIDRAQVALYRTLLLRTEEVDARPVILRFNPSLTSTTLSPDAADELVEQRLLPLIEEMVGWIERPETAPPTRRNDLCPACPLRVPCFETYRDRLPPRDDPPASATRPRPEPTGFVQSTVRIARPSLLPPPSKDDEGAREAEEVKAQILAILKRHGAKATAKEPKVGARIIEIEVSAAKGRIGAIDRASEDVQHVLRTEHGLHAEYVKDGGLRVFAVARRTPRTVALAPLVSRAAELLGAKPGRFIIGERPDGTVLTGDLSSPTACHLLVGGTTGSGKSVLLRSITASLAHYHPPSSIRFTLIDPKRVSFSRLASGLAAHLAAPLTMDAEQALPLIEDLVEDMNDRYRQLEAEKVQDIDEYNESRPESDRMPRHVVIVDEFQDLLYSKETRVAFTAAIQRLGAKARAAGIHLVLATQRPTKDNVPTSIKANLPGKIALRTSSAVESRVVIDRGGAEKLLGSGDLLADLGRGIARAQAPLD
jgi:DNA segregation ATPase FtsK/SpoIIIE, S-DNA-T family